MAWPLPPPVAAAAVTAPGGVTDSAFRPLDRNADRALVEALFRRAADYVALETGLPPGPEQLNDFFDGAPPGGDPATGLRSGMFIDGELAGIAELAFGFPEPDDAYLGLMLLAPEARGRGLGPRFLAHVTGLARARGAQRMLLAVLDANPRGRAFWERHGFRHVLTAPPARIGVRTHLRHRMARPI